MTRVFLAAGVAALAIAAPAYAGPHGGGKADRQTQVNQTRADRQAARAERQQVRTERVQQRAQRVERQQMRAERPQRAERVQMRAERPARVERQQMRAERVQRIERQQARAERQQARTERVQRVEAHQQARTDRLQQIQARQAERQQVRVNRVERAQVRAAQQQQLRAERIANRQVLAEGVGNGRGYGVGGCPPGLDKKPVRCVPPGLAAQALSADRIANADVFRTSRLAALTVGPRVRTRVLAPAQAVQFIGQPVNVVSNTVPLMVLPASVSYLYPDTPDYYYRYGDGYLYQVDRSSSLIAALLPLLAGGFMPGTYLPNQYMSSYVPSYYGLSSFYPSSYGVGYGGYNSNLCNRYGDGVIYQVDCFTGMVVDVIPLYAGGYGVGQMLPSAYSYYNVPSQYRDLYYDTPDYGYWYAPGAIYQYDQQSSLITSVAALMAPGFSIGQPLPMGYNVYNVPYDYRATYYDTPNAWYRYNNGYIYQVDPVTQLVTAIVASVLRA